MEVLWYCLVAVMLTAYVILDGFDLGAGIVQPLVARTLDEKRLVLRTIGPVWDGNEVWLLAAGGTLYFAFPGLYASSFSGFYLPLMIVLWLLILRGIAVELRNHVDHPVWKPFWDAGFFLSSLLLAIFFGVALGNVIRGVPLDRSGTFFLPLWTDFRTSGELGILDWYTILVGLLAFSTLTMHGSLWVALKTAEPIEERALRVARGAWFGVAVLTLLVTYFTFQLQLQVPRNLAAHPWGYVFPAVAIAGLIAALFRWASVRVRFLGSSAYIAGMMASAAFGVFPYVLPARPNPELGLTLWNTATSGYGLRIGLTWWLPALVLVLVYFTYTYRKFTGKVGLDREGY